MTNFIRYCVQLILTPFLYAGGFLYHHYRQVRLKHNQKIVYKDIVDGFSYMIVKDSEVERIAKERAQVCAVCPHAKYIGKHKGTIIVQDKVVKIKSMKCNVCGCALAAKVRAMDADCPRGKWEAKQDTV